MRNAKGIAAAAFACALALVTAGCGGSASDSAATDSSEAADSSQAANPWVEVASLEEAAEATGFDLVVPDSIEGYDERVISVMDDQIIQALYKDEASGSEICIRKGADSVSDISGDHNNYREESQANVGGREVGLMGNDGTVSLAGWFEGDYIYSVGAYDAGISPEDMKDIIAQVE